MRTLHASIVSALILPAVVSLVGVAAAAPPVSPTRVLAEAAAREGHNETYLASGTTDSTDVDPAADRSLAPYLYVAGGDPTTERLPLRETSAHVDISGVIAHVTVRQVFENGGAKPIEAIYVFPASTRAAVHGMRMKIGERLVEAHIDRRQAARESYEAARAQGRRASLLEQERPNVFTMNVANIMPGDHIEVQLDYSELLVPEEAVYEFIFPTVVCPRYTGGADARKDAWMANPHLPAGALSPTRFDLGVHLETGVGLKEISSPSHAITVAYASANVADVKLRDESGGNRDFVLRYRLAGDKIESGLLLSPRGADGDGYFALMMEPPQRPALAQIPSREYIFLLDVSGSMHGFPLDTAKALMRRLLGQLRPTDHFDVALFSGANYVMSPGGSVPATAANIRDAIDLVERQHGGGGTELMGGLRGAYAIPRVTRATSRTVVVVTDGYVGVEAETFRFVRERLGDANLFAFGIGTSVNRALIEGLARAGRGEPFVVLDPGKAPAQADRLRAYIEAPVLTHVGVAFEGLHTTEISPPQLPDLLARRPLVLFGKYQGEPGGQVRVTGFAGGGAPFSQVLPVRASDARPSNAALRWLWARSWVATLEDERAMGGGQPVEDAITDLGLRHSLLTPFTSFVAVDHEIVNTTGQSTPVRQPLPMPAGVSNLAVASAPAVEMKAEEASFGAGGLGFGLGNGNGATGRARSLAMPAPASPPRAQRMRKVRAEDAPTGDLVREEGAARDEKDATHAVVVRASVVSTTPLDLATPERLRAAIEARLATLVWPATTPTGLVTLRLEVDARGNVTSIERVSGDTNVSATLIRGLGGLKSDAKATKEHRAGTLLVTVRIAN
ncbi:MAG TPA: VIT and VWA domain-containing protein [Polyangia bacterium]|jgi:Ca-activated chloride channel family protein|nr:VIT and VWA domain-containing protein [Polyangia bacterium]